MGENINAGDINATFEEIPPDVTCQDTETEFRPLVKFECLNWNQYDSDGDSMLDQPTFDGMVEINFRVVDGEPDDVTIRDQHGNVAMGEQRVEVGMLQKRFDDAAIRLRTLFYIEDTAATPWTGPKTVEGALFVNGERRDTQRFEVWSDAHIA